MKRKNNRMNSKSQITIFIILALIFVVGIALLFLVIRKPEITILDEKNPQAFVESCTREAVEDALALLSIHGGDITPKGSIFYNNTDVTYLCYTSSFYQPCINQRPLFVEHLQGEITRFIEPRLVGCFQDLEKNLASEYTIESSALGVATQLQSKQIGIHITKKMSVHKGESVTAIDDFNVIVVHPLYNLAEIATEIVNQESSYCHFDVLGYMILHPSYNIDQTITGEGNTIYTVTEVSTGESLTFAVRSCPLPPGY